jgi:hypothetical protein
MASRNTTAVAAVIAVNREHDHGLRVRDFNAPRLSAMLSELFPSPAINTLSVDVSDVDPVASWRLQLADTLARGLDSRFCNFLFHSPAWAGTSTCRVWCRSSVIAPLSRDEEISAAACSSACSIGVPDGRLGICENSGRFHESPARAAALTLEGRRRSGESQGRER